MDYEKKYKEALELMKDCIPDKDGLVHIRPCEIFHELKESEDEEIKKWIRNELESKYVVDNIVNNVMADKALSWLEKQGKNNGHVTLPMFTFDDILALQCCMKKVQKDEELYNQLQILHDRLHDAYWLEKQGDKPHEEKVDEAMREIEEKAKAFSDKHKGETSDEILAQMRGEQKPADKVDVSTFKDKLLELFQKFRWKSTPTNGDIIEYVDTHIQELINTIQKPAWSEEDECLLDETIEHLEAFIRISKKHGSAYSDEIQYYQRDIDWLKSLKERYTWKPSESDILLLERIANGKSNPQDFQASLGGLIGRLKKLREE